MDLWVSPKESLLVGLCFGEYMDHDLAREEISCDSHSHAFHGFLERRLAEFLPSFQAKSLTAIAPVELPSDVHWAASAFSDFGVALSRPYVLYSRDQSDITCIQWNQDRKSLFDKLIEYLGDRMELRSEDRFAYAFTTRNFEVGGWARIASEFTDRNHDLTSLFGTGTDDLETIKQRLNELVEFSECGAFFRVGCLFGSLAAKFDARARYAFFVADSVGDDVRESIATQFAENLTPALDQLMAMGFVRRNWNAQMFLGKVRDNPPSVDLQSYEGFAEHAAAERKVWHAFGQLLLDLEDIDLAVKRDDYASAMPRAFVVQRDDSIDNVRRHLAAVERDLSERPETDRMPEELVIRLIHSPEALAKRAWPNEFNGGNSRLDLMSVLMPKQKSSDANERRFASIALTLHKSYRNFAAHDQDQFTCTLEEARFVIAGVRALLKLQARLAT